MSVAPSGVVKIAVICNYICGNAFMSMQQLLGINFYIYTLSSQCHAKLVKVSVPNCTLYTRGYIHFHWIALYLVALYLFSQVLEPDWPRSIS